MSDDAWAVTDVRLFEEGELVVDRESDDPEPAVVLAYRRDTEGDLLPAWAAPIQALDGKTVARVNGDYPRTDPVVTVVFESWLDANIGARWRTWLEDDQNDLLSMVDWFARKWHIPMQTYDYPHTRLERVGGDDGSKA